MYIGIDLGTSAVKIVLVNNDHVLVASTERSFSTKRPKPGWSEQDPDVWFENVAAGLDELAEKYRDKMVQVAGIGLSGQMHGVVLLDKHDEPVRRAILWNDGRAVVEAAELNLAEPELVEITGVQAMPGFTGPKLLWLSRNEPENMDAAKLLLFPKDYVRMKLCGEKSTDVSDAAGSWLLDQKRRQWSRGSISACRADSLTFPEVFESAQPTGVLHTELANRWALPKGVIIAAGAGDVASGCVGIGAVDGKRGLISLGTSAQVVLSSNVFEPKTRNLVHTFCHALPDTWIQMAAMLNGTSVLNAVSCWIGEPDIGTMITAAEKQFEGPGELLALPYLSGERTPHNDNKIRGAIIGLSHSSSAADITLAFLESIAFSLSDGLAALKIDEDLPTEMALVGGGSKSAFLAELISSILGIQIVKYEGAEFGPALGAARLARLANSDGSVDTVITPLSVQRTFEPDAELNRKYEPRIREFRRLYQALRAD